MEFNNPSLMTRIAIGKALGLMIGLIAFFIIPVLWPEPDPFLRWGVLLWYTTLGGMIGLFGVVSYHPVLHLPLPWWARSAIVGGWFNFVLAFFVREPVGALLAQLFGEGSVMASAFWLVAVGLLVGWLIGFLATRFGGEGPATVQEIEQAALKARGQTSA